MKLPGGLVDTNVEFFVYNDEVMALYKGEVLTYDTWPEELKEAIENIILQDAKAKSALFSMGLSKRDDMITKYVRCVFGNFDNDADVCMETLHHEPEYIECIHRGVCPHEGKLCKTLKVADGYISHQEMRIIKMIGEGLFDKEIADKLGISVNTVPVHKTNIMNKTGLRSKVEIARWATERNL